MEETILTPLELSALMHIYTSPSEWESPMKTEVFIKLYNYGACEKETFNPELPDGSKWRYVITNLGMAWCKDILMTEPPKQVFLNQAGVIIHV